MCPGVVGKWGVVFGDQNKVLLGAREDSASVSVFTRRLQAKWLCSTPRVGVGDRKSGIPRTPASDLFSIALSQGPFCGNMPSKGPPLLTG